MWFFFVTATECTRRHNRPEKSSQPSWAFLPQEVGSSKAKVIHLRFILVSHRTAALKVGSSLSCRAEGLAMAIYTSALISSTVETWCSGDASTRSHFVIRTSYWYPSCGHAWRLAIPSFFFALYCRFWLNWNLVQTSLRQRQSERSMLQAVQWHREVRLGRFLPFCESP